MHEDDVREIMYIKIVGTYLFSFFPHDIQDRNENNHATFKSRSQQAKPNLPSSIEIKDKSLKR